MDPWWWLGSAVDKPNLTRLFEEYHTAGIGGVEICLIYGARGYESRKLASSEAFYLQLQPGESCILCTFVNERLNVRQWTYFRNIGTLPLVTGRWKVEFVEGGPVIPATFDINELVSWTKLSDSDAARFVGTARYTIEFDRPPEDSSDGLLDLGRVWDSARVKLNGHEGGGFWSSPLGMPVGQ